MFFRRSLVGKTTATKSCVPPGYTTAQGSPSTPPLSIRRASRATPAPSTRPSTDRVSDTAVSNCRRGGGQQREWSARRPSHSLPDCVCVEPSGSKAPACPHLLLQAAGIVHRLCCHELLLLLVDRQQKINSKPCLAVGQRTAGAAGQAVGRGSHSTPLPAAALSVQVSCTKVLTSLSPPPPAPPSGPGCGAGCRWEAPWGRPWPQAQGRQPSSGRRSQRGPPLLRCCCGRA